MAESNNRVRIDFDVNAQELVEITKAINILDKFNKQASQVTNGLGTLSGSMNNNAKSVKNQKDELINLDRAMNAWSSRLKNNQSMMQSYEASQAKLTQKLKQYGRDVKVSVDETGKLSASFKNAEGNLVSMSGSYDKTSNSIKNMKTQLSTASMEVKKKAEADRKAVQEMDRLHAAALKVNKGLDEQKKRYQELTRGTDISRVVRMNGDAFNVMNHAVKANGEIVRASMDRNGKWTQTLKMQDGTLRSLTGYYDRANKKLIQYSEAVSRSEKSMKGATTAANRYQRELTNLERSMQGLNKYTLSWADAIEIAGTRMLQWNVAGTMIFGIQRGFRNLLNVIFEIDAQMTQLFRVLPEETNFNEMWEDSIRLSTTFGRTLTDINEAMITFARSGFNEVDTRFLSEAATLMANVSDIDMFDASETITSAITLFNIEARDAIQIVNKLNEVDNDYSISTQQLAKSITRAGGTAASFGVSLNELLGHTTAIGVATRESGQIIGNSLKSIYSRVNTLDKARSAIEALGISMTLPNGDNRDVADIMNDIAKKWPELNNAQKQNTAISVAGTYQLNRFLALMNNYQMGLDATKTAQHSYNSAVKENEKFMISLAAKLNLMKSAFMQLSFALGEAGLYKAIHVTLEALINMGQGLTKIVEALGAWTFAIPVAAAALGAFVLQFQKTRMQMVAFQATMLGMNTSLSRQALAMTATATTSTILGRAFVTLRTAALGLTAALLTNPFTWITVALTAIPMLIGHFKRLKAEHEALMKKAEDNTKAFKDFKKEVESGDVSQTSIDVFAAKTDVAGKALERLEKAQNKAKKAQESAKVAYDSMNHSYAVSASSIQMHTNWQDTLSKKTKEELADIGIKYDKYKSIEELMAAVKKRQGEYSDAVNAGNSVLEEAEKKLMFHADAFEEVGEKVEETMDIMKLFFGVNDQMVQQLIESYNAIQVLSQVKTKDAAQTEALEQAWAVWEARLGLTRQEIMKNPDAMKENIDWQLKMKDKWGEATQKILTNEEQKQLAVDITKQKTKEAADEQIAAEKKAAEEKAKAAEEEVKRKGKAFEEFRRNMALNKALNLGMTAEEVSNATLRGDFNKKSADKSIAAMKGENKQTVSTQTAYDKLKQLQNTANETRQKNQFKSGDNIKKNLESERKQTGTTAKGHQDSATKVSNAAKNKKDNVIKHAGTQNKEHKRLSKDETGSVSSGWDKMWKTVSKIMDWIKGLFGIKTSSKKTSGSLKGNGIDRYAKGTSASGHGGGPAIVGEEGPELAHIPNLGTTVVGKSGPELLNLPKGTSVLPNKHTERVLKSYGFPAYAGGVGNFFDAITKGPKAVWESAISKFGLSDKLIPKWFVNHSGSPTKYITSLAVDKVKDMLDSAIGSFGDFAGAGSDMAQKAIAAALKITGQSMSWMPFLMTVAKRESGFNPRAINLWDINAKRGIPSKGMFQTIDPTFNAHKLAGMNDIWNPLHNAVAAIRYMISRYGGIGGHPAFKSMKNGGGYKPYANGGIINKPHMGLVGEAGPEAIIPLSANRRSRALDLYEQTGKALGVRAYANGGIVGGKYKIKYGDTLSELAVRFKTTVKNLMDMNKQIKNANKIYAGQYLTIKQSSSTSKPNPAPAKKSYTKAQADSKFQSTNDYVSYMQGMNAHGYDSATYKTWKLRSIKDYMPYASTATKQDYNKQYAQALSEYDSVSSAKTAFNQAGWYGLSKEQKASVWKGIQEDVVANAVEKLSQSTSAWLNTFNDGLSEANQKVTDWLSLADQMRDKQAALKKEAFVDNYVNTEMEKYGMIEKKSGAEAIQERMDQIKQQTESLLTDNAEINYQNNPAEFAKRKAQLDKEQKTIQDKINSVTADAKKRGLTTSQYSDVLGPLKDKLAELNAAEKELADATTTNNNILKANETTINKLGTEYQKLQKELEETTKKTEMLDMIKEKITSLFNWNSNSLFTEKTDEFGNVVRDIEGTIRSVLDVQKAIQDITSNIYENIDKTVEEMISNILTAELPDLSELFGGKSDYSGIANGINGAIDTIKPTWDEALSYMSGSMVNMFTGTNWQDTMKKWTKNMAISMEGLAPLFENLMFKFPEVIGKIMSELPSLVSTAMQNLTVGVFNTVIEILNRLVATVNQIVPADKRVPMFDKMQYATPTYTQNNETTNNNDTKTYQVGGAERNVTYVINTGVAIASESELREFAMLLKGLMEEEEGRGES